MLGKFASALVGSYVRVWLGSSDASWRRLPQPMDEPFARAGGDEGADRILMIGSGASVGYGVVSHDLALAGHLARQVSAITGRGAEVTVIADSGMTPARAEAALVDNKLAQFDALLLTLGGFEALQLMSRRLWKHQLEYFADRLDVLAPTSVRIFLLALPNMPTIMRLPPVLSGAVGRRCSALNSVTKRICLTRERLEYVKFDPRHGNLHELVGRATYQEWASLIAPSMAARLGTPLAE